MISICKAVLQDATILSELATITFCESHGKSAPQQDIHNYVSEKYSVSSMQAELANEAHIYHLVYYNQIPVGFSKIILNCSHPNLTEQQLTKLERLYILEAYYDKKLGLTLFNFNLNFSKRHHQVGMWLYVWKENKRALHFYFKNNFEIMGSYDFKISDSHANPNYHLLLRYT